MPFSICATFAINYPGLSQIFGKKIKNITKKFVVFFTYRKFFMSPHFDKIYRIFVHIRGLNAINLKRIKKNRHALKTKKVAFFYLHLPKNVL